MTGKCTICREKPKANPMASVCGFDCALTKANRDADKRKAKVEQEERRAHRASKEALKTRSDWMREAQTAFNAFIRARDAGKPCICCGKPFEPQKIGGSVDAGHYRSRGSAPHLRFDERNCHAQRKNCNRPGGTTHDSFRAGMIARIGLEALEALEADQEPRKWTIEELKAIKATYKAKLKQLREATC